MLEFLSDASKAYLAEITFGVETDSADADGAVTAVRAVAFSDGDLNHALERFRGAISQTPPAHSAIKIGGKRAYDLARAGHEVEIPERRRDDSSNSTLSNEQATRCTLYIDCSKGTYIRSIARDLGTALGCGAYLSNLVRTTSGPFMLCDAWTTATARTIDRER